MLHDDFIDAIRQRVPGAMVILAKGSAIGSLRSVWSDVDFDVLVERGDAYWPWWIDEDESGRLTHISVAVTSIETWESELDDSQDWAFGFPVSAPCRLLWIRDAALRARFDLQLVRHPAGPPELEDTIESLGKARAATRLGDPLRFWPALHDIGRLAPTVARAANPEMTVSTRRAALEAALSLPNVPDGWCEGISLCLGIDRRKKVDMEEALTVATALVMDTIGIVASLPEDRLRDVFDPWEVDSITSGRLVRYLARSS